MKNKKALIVLTNHSDFENPKTEPTGLWLSEFTHFYDEFEKAGVSMDIVSPSGGKIPVDQRSLGRMVLDKATKERINDLIFMSLLENTQSIFTVDWKQYDIIFFLLVDMGPCGILLTTKAFMKLREICTKAENSLRRYATELLHYKVFD